MFTNLNLTFKENNIIVGVTGIGKTSLLLLIAQKDFNFKGKILINGNTDLTRVSYEDWQKICIYLSPNPIIHSGTVLDNILSFDSTEKNLLHFQQLAFTNILTNLGLTPLYHCQEYGANLSQGQRQIIIFLSLFFHNWKIILLDEILSNINGELKIGLITLLLDYFKTAIIIYTGHDLSIVKLFTNVINLNDKNITGDK